MSRVDRIRVLHDWLIVFSDLYVHGAGNFCVTSCVLTFSRNNPTSSNTFTVLARPRSARQTIPSILWNPKSYYPAHRNFPVVPFPSQIQPSNTIKPYFRKTCFISILPPTSRSSKWSLSFEFSDRDLVCTWGLLSFGMLHHTVRWIVTRILEKCVTSIFREQGYFSAMFLSIHTYGDKNSTPHRK